MVDTPVPGNRQRGRQKTRWKDSCKRDLESLGLKREDVLDRTKWKRDMESVGLKREDVLDRTKWKRDMESVGLKREDVLDRTKWKRDMESVGLKMEAYWTGKSGREIFKTLPVTPVDGKSLRRRIYPQRKGCQTV